MGDAPMDVLLVHRAMRTRRATVAGAPRPAAGEAAVAVRRRKEAAAGCSWMRRTPRRLHFVLV